MDDGGDEEIEGGFFLFYFIYNQFFLMKLRICFRKLISLNIFFFFVFTPDSPRKSWNVWEIWSVIRLSHLPVLNKLLEFIKYLERFDNDQKISVLYFKNLLPVVILFFFLQVIRTH